MHVRKGSCAAGGWAVVVSAIPSGWGISGRFGALLLARCYLFNPHFAVYGSLW